MKKILLIFVIILFNASISLAQEQIIDKHGNTFYAYVVETTLDSLTIIDEFNTEIKIPASQIKSRERLFCKIIMNSGKEFVANLGKVSSEKVYFHTKIGEELIIEKFLFGAIILNDRKLTSANWRPLSFDDLLLED